ncbi:MAG TPA: phosphotriesterase-related protein [Blastocatellia bacterium]|jgi:phosphotriesterase-related protein|nr:phosphotriesterase-related protein [Blastocatellia bacterium]
MTVRGPVPVEVLGITLPHEHLLADLQWPGLWPNTSPLPELVEEPVTMNLLGLLRRDIFVTHDNLRLLDADLAGRELKAFADAGGRTLCELSTEGLGQGRERLPDISSAAGVNIVAGCGWYVGPAHPDYVPNESIDQLVARLMHDLEEGFSRRGDQLVRAGLIGEIGTSGPLRPDEEKCLRAAVRAQRRTGVALSVHLSSWNKGAAIPDILKVLASEKVEPNRVALGHMCMGIDRRHQVAAARRGYMIEFDTFGYEGYYMLHEGTYGSIWQEPRDSDRLGMISQLIDRGFESQILISQDVYTKSALLAYGGYGYGHILNNVVPMMKRMGFNDRLIHRLLIDNPRTLLAGS